MSLYNLIYGVNPAATLLLQILDLDYSRIPRFRDAFVHDEHIIVYTRTGGGNRAYYDSLGSCKEHYPEYFLEEDPPSGPWNSDLISHPLYVRDRDDDFDSTYAWWYFRVPEAFKEEVATMKSEATPREKWERIYKLLSEKDNPETLELMQKFQPMIRHIRDALDSKE